MPKLNSNTYSINQYFTQLRITRGVTQKDVSKQTGIPYRTVQRLEQHRAVINAEQIEKFCRFFRVSLVEMAQGSMVLRPSSSIKLLGDIEKLPEPIKQTLSDPSLR